MPKSLFAVIPAHLSVYFSDIIRALQPEVFSEIIFGESVSDFLPEFCKESPRSCVFVVASRSAFEIIKAFQEKCGHYSKIEWVHSLLTGIDAYRPRELAAFLHAPMSNARGCYSRILAEHVAMCCLYFSKQTYRITQNHVNKKWDVFPNTEMYGKTLGIVGYGNIGRSVARLMSAFGIKCIGHRRKFQDVVDDIGVTRYSGEEGLEHVLSHSDFVVAILPKTLETDDFFSATRFQQMKKNAVFINIGRGSTVREDDLIEALQSNHLKGAALDVYKEEPLPKSSKLWDISSEKLLLTSHNADISTEAFEGSAKHFCELATSYVKNGVLPEYLVNLQDGY